MRKLSVSEWCCAVRFNKNNDSIMTDLGTPFVVLPNSKGTGVQIRSYFKR